MHVDFKKAQLTRTETTSDQGGRIINCRANSQQMQMRTLLVDSYKSYTKSKALHSMHSMEKLREIPTEQCGGLLCLTSSRIVPA